MSKQTYTNPVTGEKLSYTPFAELNTDEQAWITNPNESGVVLSHLEEIIADHKGFDVLINNKWGPVKQALMNEGFGFEKFIEDENPNIRIFAGIKGYGLDKLFEDPNPTVHKSAIAAGYGLNTVFNEETSKNLTELVDRAYYESAYDKDYNGVYNQKLNKLPSEQVVAARYLWENDFDSLSEWADAHPEMVIGVADNSIPRIEINTPDTLSSDMYNEDLPDIDWSEFDPYC